MSEETPKKPRSILCVECKKADSTPGNKYCTACKRLVISRAKADGKIYDCSVKTIDDRRGRKTLRSTQELGGMADMDRDGPERGI